MSFARGISFRYSKYGMLLNEILDSIDVHKYVWDISEDEIYEGKGIRVDVAQRMNGQEFQDFIQTDNRLVIFINIKAYPKYVCEYPDIYGYEDYLVSECQIVLLCSDSDYWEIYAKDFYIIEIIRKNAEKNQYREIEYITDENDCRTRFHLW